jgi:Flp pilus assembly protein CpaB
MRAFAIEVSEQSGVSGFILPGHRVDVVRFDANERNQQQRGETILQNVLVLAAGQVFTRPEEKSVQSRTVTVAVTPEQVDLLVAARAKGPLSLSLRGVNDHDIVEKPKRKAVEDEAAKLRQAKLEEERRREREADKAARLKLEKELSAVKAALAKKLTEPPPPPPPAPQLLQEPRTRRWVAIYHGPDNLVRVAVDDPSVKDLVQKPRQAVKAGRFSIPALADADAIDTAEDRQRNASPDR